ncbi:hypothetical protein BJY01DRAFT_245478 [Aspergillus pseudoustus]|uniref:Xylanolytic transcriptional activator regulatory domain-containing protein n=1 Tax=Aspergillus pseudoustus TaxID=1810923 RepID=A0ABR4KDF6_9EURO
MSVGLGDEQEWSPWNADTFALDFGTDMRTPHDFNQQHTLYGGETGVVEHYGSKYESRSAAENASYMLVMDPPPWDSSWTTIDPSTSRVRTNSLIPSPALASHSNEDLAKCVCNPPCTFAAPWVESWCRTHLDPVTQARAMDAGVFSFPPYGMTYDLLKRYFQFRHYQLPVLSEWEFHRLVDPIDTHRDNTLRPISLALLYVILFIASSFVTSEEADSAGFASPGAMRRTFYVRAKVLYEAGCETDTMRKAQICLLMSASASPTLKHGLKAREYWIIEAQDILKKADIVTLLTQTSLASYKGQSQWKLIYACYILRVRAFILGSYRLRAINNIPLDMPHITVNDMDKEFQTPWHLSVAIKRRLVALFLASLQLFRHASLICSNIIQQAGETGRGEEEEEEEVPSVSRLPIASNIEQCERNLAAWRKENADLIRDQVLLQRPPPDDERPLFAYEAFLKLAYEFVISTLHQTPLSFDSNLGATPWVTRLQEASHEALWESAARTTQLIYQAMSWDLLRFLPSVTIMSIFIPLAINGTLLKASTTTTMNHSTVIHSMSTLLRALESMSETCCGCDGDVDFFLQLHHKTLDLAQRCGGRGGGGGRMLGSQHAVVAHGFGSGSIALRAQSNIYSQVLKLYSDVLSGKRSVEEHEVA